MKLAEPNGELIKCAKCGCETWAPDFIYETGTLNIYCKDCGYSRGINEISFVTMPEENI